MDYDVFISHAFADEDDAPEDRMTAANLRDALEREHITCWIAPRDIRPGGEFTSIIPEAIRSSSLVVLVFTSRANRSRYVAAELAIAMEEGRDVLAFQCENVEPSDSLRLPLATRQRLPAYKHDREQSVRMLLEAVRAFLPRRQLTDPVDTELDLDACGQSLALGSDGRARLEAIAQQTAKLFEGTPGPELWTVHGLRHSNGIVRHLCDVAPPRLLEDEDAAFPLLAAACLHDVGLLPPERVQDIVGPYEAPVDRWSEADHHRWSSDLVLTNADKFGLTPQEADAVGALCLYHNDRTNPQELASNPDRATMAAAFRIANACDLGPLRAPGTFWKAHKLEIYDSRATNPAGTAMATFWLRNLLVTGVSVDRGKWRIELRGRVPDERLNFVPRQVPDQIGRSLALLTPFVGAWRIDFERDLGFGSNLSVEDIVRLGAHMFSDPEAILSSSSEIVEYFVESVLALTDTEEPRVPVADPIQVLLDVSETLVSKRPELQGLHHLKRTLQDAIEAPASPPGGQPTSGATALKALHSAFAPLRRAPNDNPLDRDSPLRRIADEACAALREDTVKSCEGSLTVFVFGQSGPVSAFIELCNLPGHDLHVKVFTPVMRPVGEGPNLKVVEAVQAPHRSFANVETEVVPDAAIPYVLRWGQEHSKAEGKAPRGCDSDGSEQGQQGAGCDLVLMGCEALFDPAGPSDPLIASSLGCRSVALLAQGSNTPVWVLTESNKEVHPIPDGSAWSKRDLSKVGRMPASAFLHEPVASEYASRGTSTYPRSELVEARLIDRVITEEGVVYPGEPQPTDEGGSP